MVDGALCVARIPHATLLSFSLKFTLLTIEYAYLRVVNIYHMVHRLRTFLFPFRWRTR